MKIELIVTLPWKQKHPLESRPRGRHCHFLTHWLRGPRGLRQAFKRGRELVVGGNKIGLKLEK